MEKTPYVMQQYETQKRRKLQQEYAEKNYQLGVATLARQKEMLKAKRCV